MNEEELKNNFFYTMELLGDLELIEAKQLYGCCHHLINMTNEVLT